MKKREYEGVIEKIAEYVHTPPVFSKEAYQTALLSFADSIGCAVLALNYPECTKLLGPIVPGTIVPLGARIPGTSFILDPILAAFNLGMMIRWLDFNDTWLAEEWGHPSDNIGGLLSVFDFLCQRGKNFTGKDLLEAIIQAYEIQGVLALKNSLNKVGLDHVLFVKVATAAVVSKLLGATLEQTKEVLSQVFIDGGPLRTYRHAPNTGSRKSWAAGDATARGVFLAYMTMKGEKGYLTALTTPRWGFEDVLFRGKKIELEQDLSEYVIDNILFKISYPAEFHAQTAVECALFLHEQVKDRLEEIECIEIETQESAMRIIDKKGPLYNPADRDHCLQYMIAIALIYGNLTADHYEKETSQEERIDHLRNKMNVRENKNFSRDYLDPEKRSIANQITIKFKEGTILGPVTIEYPLGHKRRREESLPFLFKKLKENLLTHYSKEKTDQLLKIFQEKEKFLEVDLNRVLREVYLPC